MRVWAFAVFFVHVAFSQAQSNADAILHKVRDTYANAKQLHFAVTVTEMSKADGKVSYQSSSKMEFAMRSPNLLRFSGNSAVSTDPEPALFVADGKNGWAFLPERNQYMKTFPVTGAKIDESEIGDPLTEGPNKLADYIMSMMSMLLQELPMIPEGETKLLREESINTAGVPTDCYVLKAGDSVIWIDKARYVVLRIDSEDKQPKVTTTLSVVASIMRVNESLADDLFKFTPPPGAKLVEKFDLQRN